MAAAATVGAAACVVFCSARVFFRICFRCWSLSSSQCERPASERARAARKQPPLERQKGCDVGDLGARAAAFERSTRARARARPRPRTHKAAPAAGRRWTRASETSAQTIRAALAALRPCQRAAVERPERPSRRMQKQPESRTRAKTTRLLTDRRRSSSVARRNAKAPTRNLQKYTVASDRLQQAASQANEHKESKISQFTIAGCSLVFEKLLLTNIL